MLYPSFQVTPPCLPHKLREQVISVCDLHIIDIVDIVRPSIIIAIGGFTHAQVHVVLFRMKIVIKTEKPKKSLLNPNN